MADKNNTPFKNLNRWFKEKWETPSGKKDYSGGENTFRPTRKVSSKTPKTWLKRKKKKILKVELLNIKNKKTPLINLEAFFNYV